MLRGFEKGGRGMIGTQSEFSDQGKQITEAAQFTETAAGIRQSARHPAEGHLPILPAFDVVREMRNRTIQVLDRIGGSQSAVQSTRDAQRLRRQGFFQALAQAGSGARMARPTLTCRESDR